MDPNEEIDTGDGPCEKEVYRRPIEGVEEVQKQVQSKRVTSDKSSVTNTGVELGMRVNRDN